MAQKTRSLTTALASSITARSARSASASRASFFISALRAAAARAAVAEYQEQEQERERERVDTQTGEQANRRTGEQANRRTGEHKPLAGLPAAGWLGWAGGCVRESPTYSGKSRAPSLKLLSSFAHASSFSCLRRCATSSLRFHLRTRDSFFLWALRTSGTIAADCSCDASEKTEIIEEEEGRRRRRRRRVETEGRQAAGGRAQESVSRKEGTEGKEGPNDSEDMRRQGTAAEPEQEQAAAGPGEGRKKGGRARGWTYSM